MIKSLHIENFKCFEDQCFELGNLTLLTGLNGTGKSSVIQSLLLLRQSHQGLFLQQEQLQLNGDLIELGSDRDVIFVGRKKNEFGFCLNYSEQIQAEWRFEHTPSDVGRAHDIRPSDVGRQISEPVSATVYETSLFGDNFHYLAADRIGPKTTFETSDYAVRDRLQLGIRGEYAPYFLYVFQSEQLTDNRAHPNAATPDLIRQVEAWMGEISPGVRIELTYFPGINQIDLRYNFPIGNLRSDSFRSTNVGFGITYTLPIVVALLAAEKDTLVLLENPESHLHPQGQAKLGELMARAASCGVQVIVESHSDHVLNGIRIAVRGKPKAPDKPIAPDNPLIPLIAPEDVRLYYLSRPTGQLSSTVDEPRVDKDGRIDNWPEGFFDEWEKSLSKLL